MSQAESHASDCPDCGTNFPLRTFDRICQKCEKLARFKRNTADYQEIEVHLFYCLSPCIFPKEFQEQPQCQFCGITRRNNMPVIEWKLTCGAELCVQEAHKSSTETTTNNSACFSIFIMHASTCGCFRSCPGQCP